MSQCKRIRSDGAPELELAIKSLTSVIHEISVPYRPQSNSIAERYNQRVLHGARALLLQSGLPYDYWPAAVWSWSCVSNITRVYREDQTPFKLRFQKDVPSATQVPMGTSCVFIHPRSGQLKFEPAGSKGIVISRHFTHHGIPLRDYDVLSLGALQRGELPLPTRTIDIDVLSGFPLNIFKFNKLPTPSGIGNG